MALPKQNLVIGLTGGIGSGKSVATRIFEGLGIPIIDTDAISHALSHPPSPALAAIQHTFGTEYLHPDGSMNRAMMRKLVFSNPKEKHKLESIFHPLIMQSVQHALAQTGASAYVVLIVPLLFEHGTYLNLCQFTLSIDCPPQEQLKRVMERSQLPPEEVGRIIATQTSRELRLKQSQFTITNNHTISGLKQQIHLFHQSMMIISAQIEQ